MLAPLKAAACTKPEPSCDLLWSIATILKTDNTTDEGCGRNF